MDMDNKNVHHVDQNQREDLLHTDTVASGGIGGEGGTGIQPAGYEQSLNPTGEVPGGGGTEGDTATLPSDDAGPIAARVGNDPSNLGDDIPSGGDVVHPGPVNVPIGKTPGM
jgi:hypothetical protein